MAAAAACALLYPADGHGRDAGALDADNEGGRDHPDGALGPPDAQPVSSLPNIFRSCTSYSWRLVARVEGQVVVWSRRLLSGAKTLVHFCLFAWRVLSAGGVDPGTACKVLPCCKGLALRQALR